MRGLPAIGAIAALCFGTAAHAVDLAFPAEAALAATALEELGSQRLPTAPFADDTVPAVEAEGAIVRQAWRVGTGGLTSLQLLAPLREQLSSQGYEILFQCRDRDCGGFDFRYALDLLPEPDMHVDLGDYRYLLAGLGPEGDRTYVALVTSRSERVGFVHVTRVDPPDAQPIPATAPAPDAALQPATPVAPAASAVPPSGEPALLADGHVVLDGLVFATGSVELADGASDDLEALAAFLRDNPAARVALVGHTDAVGSLEANTTLSRRRAEAVRDRLISAYGVSRAQLEAQGAGYLAPRATNRTEDGRALNRRVEAVLLSTE